MTSATAEITRTPARVPLAAITPNPKNPRHAETLSTSLAPLARSIEEQGLLQPIVVRPMDEDGMRFELLAGERRFRACLRLGWDDIPAIIVQGLSETDALAICITENLQRKDLSALEESKGVADMIALCEGNVAEAARRLARPPSSIARLARLQNLSPAWKTAAATPGSGFDRWSAAHLELVARLPHRAQDALLARYPKPTTPGALVIPSIHELRKQITEETHQLALAPWSVADPTVVSEAGACNSCPKRSSCQPALFDLFRADAKLKTDDRCLDAECWNAKLKAFSEQTLRRLLEQYPNLVLVTRNPNPTTRELHGRPVAFGGTLKKATAEESGAFPCLEIDDAGDVIRPHLLWAQWKHAPRPTVDAPAATVIAPTPPPDTPSPSIPVDTLTAPECEDAAPAEETTGEGAAEDDEVVDSDETDSEEGTDEEDSSEAASPASSRAAVSPATKKPKAVRREVRLESKRGMLAAKILLAQLEKTPPPPPEPAVLLRLVAAFGGRTPVDMRSWSDANATSSAKTLLAPWISFDKSGSASDDDVRAALWKDLLKILRGRLAAYGRMPVLAQGTTAWKEVRAIVKTLGLDRAQLEQQVTLQIPTPKSWGKAA